MKNHLLFFLITLYGWLAPNGAAAQAVAKDTVQFVADRVVLEDDPNSQNYVFTLYSPDGAWKVQLNYYADSMFGTFGNADFHLDGEGKYYNHVRNPKNDMQFWSLTDIEMTVTDLTREYRVVANCLASNRTRFLIEGSIAAIIPTDTTEVDLGYASVMENPFYGTWTFEAENAQWHLAYGTASTALEGTFYRADLLLPELTDKRTGEKLELVSATAQHTRDADGTLHLVLDVVTADMHCLRCIMWNAPREIAVTQEVDIDLGQNCALQDLTDMYGCYQFGGQTDEWGVAIALKPEAVKGGRTEWTMEDMIMPYTNLVRMPEMTQLPIHEVTAHAVQDDYILHLFADITTTDGTLYHVTMDLRLPGYIPPAKEVVEIDFGRVAVVDYTQGLGTMGVGAFVPDRYQMRLYVTDHKLEGDYTTDDIIADHCDVMVVTGDTYRFFDAWTVEAKATPLADGSTLLDVHMLATDTVMYHALMTIPRLRCLQDDAVFSIGAEEPCQMVAIEEGVAGDWAEYTLQFQSLSYPAGNPDAAPTDGYVFSFYLGHEGGRGIAGTYGYTDGTLAYDERHTFFEDGTEVRIAPVAGTLNIEPRENLTLKVGNEIYASTLYATDFRFVGQNGVVYEAAGENYLLCIDPDGYLVPFYEYDEPENPDEKNPDKTDPENPDEKDPDKTEPENPDEKDPDKTEPENPDIDAVREVLAEQGFIVRKVLDGHRFIVTRADGTKYDLSGRYTR